MASSDPPAPPSSPWATWRRPPRWWRLGLGALTLAVVLFILVSRWRGITGSHPAYLVTLLVVGLGAVVAIVTAVAQRARPAATVAQRAPPRRPLPTWIGRGLAVLAALVLCGVLLWFRPLPASDRALDALASGHGVDVRVSATRIELRPTTDPRSTGLIFYPGAMVDPRAYATTLRPLAEAGFPVVIIKLPFNIAFFDRNAAASVISAEGDVERWVVAGHSLGGTVAALYARDHSDKVDGLLLWASFPAGSMTAADLDVLSVSATNDALATPQDIADSAANLPPGTEFVAIEGAIHAFFGDYGSQRGDGIPTISRADAQQQIEAASITLLERIDAA